MSFETGFNGRCAVRSLSLSIVVNDFARRKIGEAVVFEMFSLALFLPSCARFMHRSHAPMTYVEIQSGVHRLRENIVHILSP